MVQFESESKRSKLLVLGSCSLVLPPPSPAGSVMSPALSTSRSSSCCPGPAHLARRLRFWCVIPGPPSPTRVQQVIPTGGGPAAIAGEISGAKFCEFS